MPKTEQFQIPLYVPNNIEVTAITPAGVGRASFAETTEGVDAEDGAAPGSGGFHIFGGHGGKVVDVGSDQFLDSWRRAIHAVSELFTADDDSDSAFALDSVVAKLSVDASGKVAFLAELKGEVAFEATFKRREVKAVRRR